jgi:hypothetical protein
MQRRGATIRTTLHTTLRTTIRHSVEKDVGRLEVVMHEPGAV